MSVKEEKVETTGCGVLDEAFDFMKKAHELINQKALDVRKEKEAFDSVAKKLDHVHFGSTVKLNVGGQYFTTSLQTLTKDTGSMLHAMFSGRFDTKPAEDGSYFIDRDGTHFRYILNYVSVKSKLQHAPPRAYPGHLTPLPSRGGGNLIIKVFQGVGNLNSTLDFM